MREREHGAHETIDPLRACIDGSIGDQKAGPESIALLETTRFELTHRCPGPVHETEREYGTQLLFGARSADEGQITIYELAYEKDYFQGEVSWVSFYAGDTEVGMLFKAGTAEVVAEISDGDALACVD